MHSFCGSAWIGDVTGERANGVAATAAGAAVTVRFWAGAKRAAGQAEEQLVAPTLAALLDQLRRRPELAAILGRASYLVDGQAADPDQALPPGAVIDVLPPFAGG
jgi:molybdopterin synthase sulfur carrier subunit